MAHRPNDHSQLISSPPPDTGADRPVRVPLSALLWAGGPPLSTALLVINIVLGVWLCLSAFLWPHTGPSLANTLIVGTLYTFAAGMGAARAIASRSMFSVLALWLVVSTILITPRTELTFWHNLMLGALALVLMLVPSAGTRRPSEV